MRLRVAMAAALCAVLALALAVTGIAYRRAVPDIMYRLTTNEKVVALTFDDGPDPRYTQAVLDILDREGVHATFFLVGRRVVARGGPAPR